MTTAPPALLSPSSLFSLPPAEVEARLADPASYGTGSVAEVTRGNTRIAAIARELAQAEAGWMEAQEALEAAEAA